MDWVLLSLASAVAFTAYTLLQKRALNHMGAVEFSVIAALLHLGLAVAIVLAAPPDLLSWGVAAMAVAGLVHVGIQLLSSYAIRRSTDISRIVPALDAYPLFVMAMAVLALGETLTPLKWGAAIMVIAGVMIAAFHETLPGKRLTLDRSVCAVLAASFCIALYSVLAKSASGEMSAWQMYSISWLFAFPGVMAAARVAGPGPVVAALRSRRALFAVGLAQAPMVVAFWTGLTAIELGPVSLSSAIMSTRPVLLLLWVAMTGLSLRRAIERRKPLRESRARWGSAALVTSGVGVIAL